MAPQAVKDGYVDGTQLFEPAHSKTNEQAIEQSFPLVEPFKQKALGTVFSFCSVTHKF